MGRKGRFGGTTGWYGDDKQSTVFHIDKPQTSDEHPTMKPIELIRPMIHNSCPPQGLIIDPFGGSGSTLLAATLEHKTAYLTELEPKYVDVICRRWQLMTGKQPTDLTTGKPHNFITEQTEKE